MTTLKEVELNQRKLEPGARNDGGKLRYDLLPARPLEEMVAVLTNGAEKYGDDNWRKGMSWSRHFAAAMRHAWAWFRGENLDRDSGRSHLAHAAVSFMFLMQYVFDKLGTDDRYKDVDHKLKAEANTRPLITKANDYGN